MVRRRAAGFTLLEVVVSMVVFGIFLMILVGLTAEMRNHEKKLPINFMRHPQVSAVVSRLRRDVLDASSGAPGVSPYLPEWPPGPTAQYTQSKQVLIITTYEQTGRKTVVWDFRQEGIVTRRSYNVGVPSDWIARGLPPEISTFELDAPDKIPGREWAVRFKAVDKKGQVALDQIFQPRAHQ